MGNLRIIGILLCSVCLVSSVPKIKVMDETQLSNPRSFDYNFEDDLKKIADKDDVYDEVVPFLPRFILHKNGKDMGYTRVPIVTRKQATWSTTPPRTRKGDRYKEWTTPVISPVTKSPRNRFSHQQRIGQRRLNQAVSKIEPTKSPRRTTPRQQTTTRGQLHQDWRIRFNSSQTSPKSQRKGDSRTAEPNTTRRPHTTTKKTTTKHTTITRGSTTNSMMKNKVKFSERRNTIRPQNSTPIIKPPIIQAGNIPYNGPTYDCRILDPTKDGRPSFRTDPSCKLSLPGFSADGKCRCIYEVNHRDDRGCATGYLYTCTRK